MAATPSAALRDQLDIHAHAFARIRDLPDVDHDVRLVGDHAARLRRRRIEGNSQVPRGLDVGRPDRQRLVRAGDCRLPSCRRARPAPPAARTAWAPAHARGSRHARGRRHKACRPASGCCAGTRRRAPACRPSASILGGGCTSDGSRWGTLSRIGAIRLSQSVASCSQRSLSTALVTNVPRPWNDFTSPSPCSRSMAWRTVTRATPNSRSSSSSVAIFPPTAQWPSPMRRRSAEATCR